MKTLWQRVGPEEAAEARRWFWRRAGSVLDDPLEDRRGNSMDTVKILRELWRLRRFVAIVGLLSVLVGVAIMYKVPGFQSRQYEVGLATTQVLVDTPNSQVAEVAPKGYDVLGVRASLLASVMVDGGVKAEIAELAGIKPSQLSGMSNSAIVPSPAPFSTGRNAYVITTQVPNDGVGDELPIIQVQIQAPTRVSASKLATATITGLRDYLSSKAALQRIPDAQRLQVSSLGVPQVATGLRGPSDALVVVAVVLVFVLGCGGILIVLSVIRGWRAAATREDFAGAGLLDERTPPLDDWRPDLHDDGWSREHDEDLWHPGVNPSDFPDPKTSEQPSDGYGVAEPQVAAEESDEPLTEEPSPRTYGSSDPVAVISATASENPARA